MTQPRGASPAAAVGEPDALLATKLHLPGIRPGFVPRPRLLERLTAGLASALTLVCAPAGFGKTALLADWTRHDPQPVAWLSLDDADNDPKEGRSTSPSSRGSACKARAAAWLSSSAAALPPGL
jgi:LuxR family maltose regulon positive regulatory protein